MGEDVRETDVLQSSVAADGGDRRLPGVGGRAAGCRPVPGRARRHRSAHPVDPERRRRLTPARAAAVVAAQSSQSTVSNIYSRPTKDRLTLKTNLTRLFIVAVIFDHTFRSVDPCNADL